MGSETETATVSIKTERRGERAKNYIYLYYY